MHTFVESVFDRKTNQYLKKPLNTYDDLDPLDRHWFSLISSCFAVKSK